jgi:hypothetical protein
VTRYRWPSPLRLVGLADTSGFVGEPCSPSDGLAAVCEPGQCGRCDWVRDMLAAGGDG